MDLGDKDNSGQEKRTMDPLNYNNPSNLSTEWQYDNANPLTQPLRMMPTNNSMEVCKGDLMGSSASSSVSMVDTFSPTLWGLPNSQTLGFCNNNLGASSSSIPTSTMGIDKTLEMGWNHPNSMLRGGGFLQTGAGILPPSLSHFPADSAFIERAARFSCFNGGNFSDLVNPLSQAQNLYSKGGGPIIQGPREILLDNRLKPISETQSQKEVTMIDVGKDFSLAVEHVGGSKGSPLKNDRDKGNFVRSYDEANQGIGVSNSEAEEAEFSGSGGQEEQMLEGACGEPSMAKGIGIKKRRRNGQAAELDQAKGSSQLSGDAMKDDIETKAKGDQNPTSSTGKATGKHGKDSSQALDTPKEDYIHVRARRGQATNSHSLAERVRREKISERMKYLQELVPGCSKVTGKAVMLDEIINYVQSLQRQVEFLSMKLATVNPRLDFSIEGLLAKDMLQSRGVPSTMGFSPDMSMGHHHQLHPSQHGLIQAGIAGTGNTSDVLRRTINSQLTAMNAGYKELTPQIPNVWDDELNNVIQMSFGGVNAPLNSEDLNGGPQAPPGHMKAEP